MVDWKIIYNDGNTISVVTYAEMSWNEAPNQNVQYVICEFYGNRTAISGLDEYTIPEPGCIPKYGKLLTDEQWAKTRQFMIKGDY